MKRLILASVLFLAGGSLRAQTNAVNFTAPDCTSGSHTLFTELDNGNVVVLVWVMPCSSCVSDAKAAYDAAQTAAAAHPGKVLYWLADDVGNQNCTAINTWATANGIGSPVILDNTGTVVKESDYGGSGMPHVVVMSGADHKIYYNKLNGSNDGTAITTAINQALAAVASKVPDASNDMSLKLYPNPAKNKISVDYNLRASADVNLEILNISGAVIKTIAQGVQGMGTHTAEINLDGQLPAGVYMLRINTGDGVASIKFTISE